jgi:hypothetical protein
MSEVIPSSRPMACFASARILRPIKRPSIGMQRGAHYPIRHAIFPVALQRQQDRLYSE